MLLYDSGVSQRNFIIIPQFFPTFFSCLVKGHKCCLMRIKNFGSAFLETFFCIFIHFQVAKGLSLFIRFLSFFFIWKLRHCRTKLWPSFLDKLHWNIFFFAWKYFEVKKRKNSKKLTLTSHRNFSNEYFWNWRP